MRLSGLSYSCRPPYTLQLSGVGKIRAQPPRRWFSSTTLQTEQKRHKTLNNERHKTISQGIDQRRFIAVRHLVIHCSNLKRLAMDNQLDNSMSQEEGQETVSGLKAGKASGLDGVAAECLKRG